jgi:glutaminyl-peptide cyclotransferase
VRGHFQTTIIAVLFCVGCDQRSPAPAPAPLPHASSSSLGQGHPANGEVWRYSYEIVNTFPHDRKAFTQGLVFLNGKLLESTGLNGQSTLREDDLATGRMLRKAPVAERYFAEGLAVLGGKAYQLTWQNETCFVYDVTTFRVVTQLSYSGEGWGLATDGHSLIMSDGTSQLRFLEPETFRIERTIQAVAHGQPVRYLNELEYVQGEIFANVWQTTFVVRIDPANGAVTGVIDFTGLLATADRDATTDVQNGIAYDDAHDRLFVTGKFWPRLFEVRLKRAP